jgi:PDZ domain-containing protein
MPDDTPLSAPDAPADDDATAEPHTGDHGPEDEGAPSGPSPRARRATRLLAAVAIVLVIVIAGFLIRLPYFAFLPGGTVALADNVEIEGARTYPDRGDLRLLFVREQDRVNVWRWLQASIDPDIDLVKRERVTGGRSSDEISAESAAQMEQAKQAATKVALERSGYEVPREDGLIVAAVVGSRPAADVLQQNDVLLEADGKPLVENTELRTIVEQHQPGDTIPMKILRDGETKDVEVPVDSQDGQPVIGVITLPRYDFPVDVEIDTSGIGGPSAGLAMTLAIIDDLTPGNLTGGKRVAVTGTISDDGTVGEIGAIGQKAVTARTEGAQVFLVPKCVNEATKAGCEADLERVRDRAGDSVDVIPVATLDEALRALRDAGGDPVPTAAASRS